MPAHFYFFNQRINKIRNSLKQLILINLLFTLFIVTACSRPNVEIYQNESAGVQFNRPQDWQIEDQSSKMILSPDPALLNEDPFANGARLIFVSIPKSTLVVPDSEAFFDANIQPFLNTPDADLTQPTEYLTIDGQNAYSAAVNGTNLLGERMIWHSTVIEGEFILILALAEVSEEHAERLDEAKEIISSIEFLTILR